MAGEKNGGRNGLGGMIARHRCDTYIEYDGHTKQIPYAPHTYTRVATNAMRFPHVYNFNLTNGHQLNTLAMYTM